LDGKVWTVKIGPERLNGRDRTAMSALGRIELQFTIMDDQYPRNNEIVALLKTALFVRIGLLRNYSDVVLSCTHC
jgi:hypothetical protein